MTNDWARYHCQIALPGFGEAAQQRLQQASVLIVGMGGLGCPTALYLTSSGVGTIGIADFDTVSEGNLHRQVLFGPDDTGSNKAAVACRKLKQQNPGIEFVPYEQRVSPKNVLEFMAEYDVVVDCTDNFETRYLLNDAAVISGKPLVYGAIYQFEGQVAVWNVDQSNGERSPNYRDLYPKVNAAQIPNCTQGGVIPTLAGIIGCLQANEVIKYITQTGELLAGKLLVFDAQTLQSRVVKIGTYTKTNIVTLPVADESVPDIDQTELKEIMARGDAQLIDVRTDEERQAHHIGGKHIPLNRLEDNLHEVDPAKTTVFYCASGKRSAEAVKIVKNALPDSKAASLKGGLNEWLDENG
ncbi:HesA/MoeB/ThiF family protein [Mucilaginibacter sp. UR6-1]|uniref:HesA/MoeB/ThiF family protein n=1 Tax=Mucilaginibacter sp. UR6-1 TaxID=1435643 RepID=UPI001E5D1E78|nr:HesA/MoeB/ThiF family protein [Mucilaginibacter sp. UR6-1]MCC8410091.1 HesA/MoeB/ThiF family protein [Mucilaginibacter sp. UR6-1]